MLAVEIPQHGGSSNQHKADNERKGEEVAAAESARQVDIHTVDAGNQCGGRHQRHNDGEHAHDLLYPVRGQPVAGIGQTVNHLLAVLQAVPDLADMVGDVAEVNVLVFLEERIFLFLQLFHYRHLRVYDTAERDKVAAYHGYLTHGLRYRPCEDEVFNLIDIILYPVQDWEAVVDQAVQYLVKQEAGAAAHVFLAQPVIYQALVEELGEWF